MPKAFSPIWRRLGAVPARGDLIRLAILTAIVAFEIDWATKSWALQALAQVRPLGGLMLGIEHNAAFAFSTGEGEVSRYMVAAVRLAALLALVLLGLTLGIRERRHALGFGMVLGGGLGNAADLFFRQHGVVDFIGTGPFSLGLAGWSRQFGLVFNTADLAVLVGIMLLSPVIRVWAVALQERVLIREPRLVADESEV